MARMAARCVTACRYLASNASQWRNLGSMARTGDLTWSQLQSTQHMGLGVDGDRQHGLDRKSTRLNSSHVSISYAVFCLKKKSITKSSSYLMCYHINET